MPKEFTSIMITLSILLLYSAKLSEDIQRLKTLKESSNEGENYLTSISKSDFIDDKRESNLADIVLVQQDMIEKQPLIKDLDQGLDRVIRDITSFGIQIDNSFEATNNLENIETPISIMTKEKKALWKELKKILNLFNLPK